MSCEDCIKLGIPERLCSDGKPLDQPFNNEDELIFRRHDLIGDKEAILKLPDPVIGDKLFKIKDDSYNRSSLCESTDVLYNEDGVHRPTYGIISLPTFPLVTLQFEYIGNDEKRICTFVVKHEPKPCNYAHAEIHFYINGVRFTGKKPNKHAVDFFRKQLLKLMDVVKLTEVVI